MSLTTLFSDGESWLASGRLVYAAHEREVLEDVLAQAGRLREIAASRETVLAEAREAARREGHEAGLRESRAAAAERVGAALARLDGVAREETRRQREAIVGLALRVVRRIAADIAPPERLAALARVAAAELVDEPRLVLHVHPTEVEALRGRLTGADGTSRGPFGPFDDVVGDEALGPDGALIETPGGRIAIDLETQLESVLAQLGDARLGDVEPGDARAGDARAGDVQAGDARGGDARAGDAQAGDARGGDAQPGDAGVAA